MRVAFALAVVFSCACVAEDPTAGGEGEGEGEAQEGEGEGEGREGEGEGEGEGEATGPLRINEAGCDDDFVEVVNVGSEPVSLAGVVVSDAVASPARTAPLGIGELPAGSFAFVRPTTFGVSCDEVVFLLRGSVVIDRLALTDAALVGEPRAAGRIPDGTGAVVATSPTPGAANVATFDPADAIFDVFGAPIEVEVVLPRASAESLRDDGYTYVVGAVTVTDANGTVGPVNVGLRKKGRIGSARPLDGKMAWKIDTNRFVPGQSLRGLKKLNLNNQVQDPSSIHEVLAYRIFGAVGAPVPRVGIAHVTVDGEDTGLYLVLEATDDGPFLERHFPSTTALFEGEYGVDLFVGGTDNFDQDFGSASASVALAELAARLDGAGNDVYATLDPVLDWDGVISVIAVEFFIGHWDGYGPTRNNYFLHLDEDGRWSLVPWGVDQTFEYPLPLYVGQGLIFQACLRDPACRTRFETQMLRTADIVEDLLAEGLDDDIRALAALNVDRYADDPRREWNHEDIPFLADRAISFLEDRIVSVRDELACTQDPNADQDGDGYACSLDCDEGNPQIFFGAREICGNSVDEDCSGYYDDSDDCPDCVLDETVVGRPIHVCRVGRSYAAAQTNCASLGARLAAPRDASDNANLFERAGRRLGEQPIWIGLDDTGPEGTYRFSDGRTWSAGRASPYTAWAEGEPNDAGGNEDCAHFLGHAAEWNDIPCDFAFASICEPL